VRRPATDRAGTQLGPIQGQEDLEKGGGGMAVTDPGGHLGPEGDGGRPVEIVGQAGEADGVGPVEENGGVIAVAGLGQDESPGRQRQRAGRGRLVLQAQSGDELGQSVLLPSQGDLGQRPVELVAGDGRLTADGERLEPSSSASTSRPSRVAMFWASRSWECRAIWFWPPAAVSVRVASACRRTGPSPAMKAQQAAWLWMVARATGSPRAGATLRACSIRERSARNRGPTSWAGTGHERRRGGVVEGAGIAD